MTTNFANDIFISYARDDNAEIVPGDPLSSWVTAFKRHLKGEIRRQFGIEARIWMDDEDYGGQQRDEKILQNVEQSALLFIILSPTYIKRPWCREERHAFLRTAGGPRAAENRIFVIRTRLTEEKTVPDELRGIKGYTFFRETNGGGSIRFGDPPREEYARDYYGAFLDLVPDAAHEIKRLNRSLEAEPGSSIYLAQCQQSLRSNRVQLANRLNDAGFRIFPERYYESDAAAIYTDLSKCSAFIQLVDERFEEADQLQWEAACKTGIATLRWRSIEPQLNPNIDAPDIRKDDFEDFQSDVVRIIRELDSQAAVVNCLSEKRNGTTVPTASIPGNVLILRAQGDARLADRASMELADFGVDNEVLDKEFPLSTIADSSDYCGLVVTVGQRSEKWARTQLSEMRRLSIARKMPPPLCAAYKDKEDDDCFLPLRFKGLYDLPDNWKPFLSQLGIQD
tara:strand:+ start:6292 stop:7650 length:1359 start_codon:yes stop_codon:yes gene_type:complete